MLRVLKYSNKIISLVLLALKWKMQPVKTLDTPSHLMLFLYFTTFSIVNIYWRNQIYEAYYNYVANKK